MCLLWCVKESTLGTKLHFTTANGGGRVTFSHFLVRAEVISHKPFVALMPIPSDLWSSSALMVTWRGRGHSTEHRKSREDHIPKKRMTDLVAGSGAHSFPDPGS